MEASNDPRLSSLTRYQSDRLVACAFRGDAMELDELLDAVEQHLVAIEAVSHQKPHVQLQLARTIASALQQAAVQWEQLSLDARHWIGGAMQYFATDDDEEPDLISPVGFEDDAAVVNVCLQCAGLEHLRVSDET